MVSSCAQGIDQAQLAGEQPVKDTDWGFATKLPDVQSLLKQASQPATETIKNAEQIGSGSCLICSALRPHWAQAVQQLQLPTDLSCCADYLAALRESRTFNCPDCVDAMAEAFGVSAAVNQLRVSSIVATLIG